MDKGENFNFEIKDPKKPGVRWLNMFTAIFWAFFVALALGNVVSPYLSNIITGLLTGIAPLLIGIVIAFITYRLVDWIEKVVLKNAFKNSPYKFGLKRFISILCVVLLIFGVIALIFAILIPRIIDIIRELSEGNGDKLTQIINNVVDQISIMIQNIFGAEVDQTSIRDILYQIFNQLKETILHLGGVMQLSMSVVMGAFNFIIGILLAVLMLKDKEKISRFTRRFLYANTKKEKADEICVMSHNANKILFDYVICKLLEFVIIVVTLGIAYAILGLKFTWELSLIIAIFNFIPYFGIYIGCVPAVLITILFNFDKTLYMLLTTIIITSIEFNVILPFITGNRLKISSLVVASSIILGGAMFNMVGMLLAPPIVAILSVIITGNIELKENRMKYVLELDKARKQHDKDQLLSMGVPLEDVEKKMQAQANSVANNQKNQVGTETTINDSKKDSNDISKEAKENSNVKKSTKKTNSTTKKITSTTKKTPAKKSGKTISSKQKTEEKTSKITSKTESKPEVKKTSKSQSKEKDSSNVKQKEVNKNESNEMKKNDSSQQPKENQPKENQPKENKTEENKLVEENKNNE